MSLSIAAPAGPWALSRTRGWLAVGMRYGVSTAGPLAVSAAHFIASLIFLRQLSAHEFGLFSFVMVVVAFGMSATASMIIVPVTQALVSRDQETRPTCLKANILVVAGFGLLLFAALLLGEAPPAEAVLLGLYGGVFAFRWFTRNLFFIDGKVRQAIASDLAYSLLLVMGLSGLVIFHQFSFTSGSEMLLAASLLSLLPFGTGFFRDQWTALRQGRLAHYRPIFRDTARWSLVGVVLTEITVNAHAYLVTFLAGAQSFALLALGMLLLRPASLVQSALPDLERPAMARAIADRNRDELNRVKRHFGYGLATAWAGNILLCAALLAFFPMLVLKKGYALDQVMLVAGICAVIAAARGIRTPLAVMLQAAGEFRALAGIGLMSAVMSLSVTLVLLVSFGPIPSLGGILAGEIVIIWQLRKLVRSWQAAHV